jgi:hypothetical protein
MKISKRLIFVWDKYGLRLNNPSWSFGWKSKIDRFIFKYYKDKYGLPCFLPLPKLKYQLIVDGKPYYKGGGVNCFNEPMPIVPVLIDKLTESYCRQAAVRGWFRVRNYSYNGFCGKLEEGYSDLKPKIKELELTNDPGIYKYKDKFIPSFAIEGVEILYKVNTSSKIPNLFGNH